MTELAQPLAASSAETVAVAAQPNVIGDMLRLDYQQTTDLLRTLNDVRFKLLALVPTLSTAAVVVLGTPTRPGELLAVGLLGLTATLGVLLYELRNSQLADYATRRAQQLETALGFLSLDGQTAPGGLFRERPARTLRLLGFATVDRERGLALVYSAALAGWTYLLAWGALRALNIGSSREIGGAVGIAVGLLLLAELIRVHEYAQRPARAAASVESHTLAA